MEKEKIRSVSGKKGNFIFRCRGVLVGFMRVCCYGFRMLLLEEILESFWVIFKEIEVYGGGKFFYFI